MNRKRGRTSGAKDPKPMRILKQASFMNYLFLAHKILNDNIFKFQFWPFDFATVIST
jgi:hypothetical protein